jgi:hypothetical protein
MKQNVQARQKSKDTSRDSYIKILSWIAIICALVFLFGSLVYLISEAFYQGFKFGIRSILACILPGVVLAYVTSYTPLLQSKVHNRNFNLFIVYALWTVFVLTLWFSLDTRGLPLIEVLQSLTLSSILKRTGKNYKDQKLVSCCYGVLSGLLGYICIFGFTNLG